MCGRINILFQSCDLKIYVKNNIYVESERKKEKKMNIFK